MGKGQKGFLLVLLFCNGGKISPETTADFPSYLIERLERIEGLELWAHTQPLPLTTCVNPRKFLVSNSITIKSS